MLSLIVLVPCPIIALLLLLLLLLLSKLSSSSSSRQRCHPHPHHSIILSSSWPGCIIYIYIFCSNLRPNNGIKWYNTSPARPLLVAPPIHTLLRCGHLFLVGCCVEIDWSAAVSGHGLFLFLFSLLLNFCHNNGIIFPPRLPLVAPPLHTSLFCGRLYFGWLLCEPLSIAGHQKATVYFIYIFFHRLNSHP